jgi:hypothetical protein
MASSPTPIATVSQKPRSRPCSAARDWIRARRARPEQALVLVANSAALCLPLLARNSDYYDQLCRICADACDACATECEQYDDDDFMRGCAQACRRCAEECRRLAA